VEAVRDEPHPGRVQLPGVGRHQREASLVSGGTRGPGQQEACDESRHGFQVFGWRGRGAANGNKPV
jgi:hypothetical protein